MHLFHSSSSFRDIYIYIYSLYSNISFVNETTNEFALRQISTLIVQFYYLFYSCRLGCTTRLRY